ncbi:phenylacetate--CoA ligase family protein [Macrococcus bovicus]|uniref:Phenylacetate--CoA ligase family protein n=1 Tax=Macrococcus bovicus TaxID=69968 RepID=A0A4R6C277_9STAP|nr:phenylacetate--CoA ligase family protein [Macrococcus bovicus]TDM14919.1 phenylacetate--CoA ligase family protein [Macrococcus bovicus]
MHKIYYKSPVFIQHVMTSIYGYKLKKKRYTESYFKHLENYRKANITEEENVRQLVNHLKNNIPFYQKKLNIMPNSLKSLLDLPMTSKEDLRNELELRSDSSKKDNINKTGGTTGKSLKVYSSINDINKRMAYLDYIKTLYGVEPFSKRGSFTGKEIVPQNHKNILWRYNWPMNQTLYASFKMNKDNVKYIYEHMSKFKPLSLDGFPSSIHLLAKYILQNNIKISWTIKAIFPTAETLTDKMREDIERAFNTKVVDQYASSEGAPFLFSDDGKKFHIGHETGLFEFFRVKDNIYDMIVTSYINEATPIVRYKIGDQVLINSTEEYLTSYQKDVPITKIIGRGTDYLVGDNGNIVTSVNMSNVCKEFGDQVIQSQFIQVDNNCFDINLVVTKSFLDNKEKAESLLTEKLNHRLGINNKYKFNYLNEIPKEKSGKTRFIINKIGG